MASLDSKATFLRTRDPLIRRSISQIYSTSPESRKSAPFDKYSISPDEEVAPLHQVNQHLRRTRTLPGIRSSGLSLILPTDTTRMENQIPGHYVYPNNPHTLTNAEVQDFAVPTFPPAPGLAPIITLPLKSTHPIVPRWGALCPEIIGILRKKEIKWESIECLRRRQHPTKGDTREDDATVVITVKRFEETPDLRDWLDEVYKLSGLYVEIAEDEICLFSEAHHLPVAQNPDNPYPIQPPMGGSIGTTTKPDDDYGTLGGYVEIFRGEEVMSCALTCDHVIKPLSGSETRVFYPSASEHGRNIADIGTEMNCKIPERNRLEQKLRISGHLDPEIQSDLDFVNHQLATFGNQIHGAILADRDIGAVFAQSGVETLTQNRYFPIRIDWALIGLQPGRTGKNKYYSGMGAECAIRYVGSPSKDSLVSKTGANTKLTHGVINGVESCFSDDINMYSMEWVIVSDGFSSPSRTQNPFGLHGDSGSFIVTRGGFSLLGMLWGGTTRGDRIYFTPMDVIAKDILKRTGYHVRLPDNGEHICC